MAPLNAVALAKVRGPWRAFCGAQGGDCYRRSLARRSRASFDRRMADRYLGDGRSFAKIGAAHRYKIGDQVFFSTGNHTVAGEGLFIGRLTASPDILVLMVGSVPVETMEKDCAPVGGNRAAEGASWRRAYLKEHPASLV